MSVALTIQFQDGLGEKKLNEISDFASVCGLEIIGQPFVPQQYCSFNFVTH